ncbi:MAG: FecR family protein [Lentisphaerales bacterium]|nr:FecR family protein [Lentisphaerales bacterium]
MSKQIRLFVSLFIISLLLIPFAHTQKGSEKDTIITGFKVIQISDKTARIKGSKGGYAKVEEGKFYAFPATIKSNRSQVLIKFSEHNTARLLPKTTLHLSSPKVRHPKLKLLDGKVALELDRFPKDHKMEVSTPTAVCGAVGTRFEVSYSGEDKQLGIDRAKADRNQSFKCTKGEIYLASNSFRIGGIKKGQAVTTKAYSGKENSYCNIALEKGIGNQSFRISLPDKSAYVATSSSFEIAKPVDSDIAVIKVKDSNLKTLGFFEETATAMTPGRAYVKVGDSYVQHAESENYLTAAAVEGKFDARLKEVDLQLALLDDVDKKQLNAEKQMLAEKRDEAAKKASTIFKRIQQDRQIRNVLQNIRRNINRQQMRKAR